MNTFLIIIPIMFIVSTLVNGGILKYRSRKYVEVNPDLKEGYDKMSKAIMIWGNVPWVIMLLGQIFGLTKTLFDFFYPKSMNPIVLVFHGSIILIWILLAYWIYFNKGAEMMATHPGFLRFNAPFYRKDITSPLAIRIFVGIGLVAGIAAMTGMWMSNITTFELPQ